MTYCWKCPHCLRRRETQHRDGPRCVCGSAMQRDYQAEDVGIGSGVRESRRADR